MSSPPPPTKTAPEDIPGQALVETVYGGDNYRVLITVESGRYRVYDEFWNTWWWSDEGRCFWCRQGPYGVLDSKEAAQALAHGRLAEHNREAED